MTISTNLANIQALIKVAKEEHDTTNGKFQSGKVKLIAVSKNRQSEQILPLLQAGQFLFGENRISEASTKWPDLKAKFSGTELHFIGQIQSKKLPQIALLFDYIHSLDKENQVDILHKLKAKLGKIPHCFIQVNIGSEPQKAGVEIDELPQFYNYCLDKKIEIVGLMCIPPQNGDAEFYFQQMQELNEKLGLPELSMGMSSDFETAIKYGATYVRIGTALFV